MVVRKCAYLVGMGKRGKEEEKKATHAFGSVSQGGTRERRGFLREARNSSFSRYSTFIFPFVQPVPLCCLEIVGTCGSVDESGKEVVWL